MMYAMDILSLLLVPLGVARLTRLVVADKLTEKPMTWVIGKTSRWGMLGYLLTCSWCVSVYVAAGVSAAWWAWGAERWFAAVCAALAASYVAGFLAGKE